MAGIGHNNGPSLQAGAGFRRVAWSRARRDLMPTLPLEIVRLRVARAKRLGLPYKTYATIRAVSGRDIVGFLFSDNALDVGPPAQVSPGVADRLITLDSVAARLVAVHRRTDSDQLDATGLFDGIGPAPDLFTPWRTARDGLRDLARCTGAPTDGVVVVAATALERGWSDTAGLAGTIDRRVLFSAAS